MLTLPLLRIYGHPEIQNPGKKTLPECVAEKCTAESVWRVCGRCRRRRHEPQTCSDRGIQSDATHKHTNTHTHTHTQLTSIAKRKHIYAAMCWRKRRRVYTSLLLKIKGVPLGTDELGQLQTTHVGCIVYRSYSFRSRYCLGKLANIIAYVQSRLFYAICEIHGSALDILQIYCSKIGVMPIQNVDESHHSLSKLHYFLPVPFTAPQPMGSLCEPIRPCGARIPSRVGSCDRERDV